jgi:hypothetical protein
MNDFGLAILFDLSLEAEIVASFFALKALFLFMVFMLKSSNCSNMLISPP